MKQNSKSGKMRNRHSFKNVVRLKKITILVIGLITCVFNVHAQTWPPAGMAGDGSSDNPWQITTAAQLEALASYVNAGNGAATAGKYYRLNNDIDLSGYTNWIPIGIGGNDNNTFCGNFDGNNKVIKNLTINLPTRNGLGLFGIIINYATIRNLGVENCNIKGGVYGSVGGLVGINRDGSAITNCYVTGVVSGGDNVGGLAGSNQSAQSAISKCYAICNVSGQNDVGGLVGYSYGSISYSYAICSVTGNNNVGGLAGMTYYSTITNCYTTGSIKGNGSSTGGLIGYDKSSTTISNCYSIANVIGNENVGGLMGQADPTFKAIIRSCVAANAFVTSISNATSVYRILGSSSWGYATLQNTYALNSMIVRNSSGNITITDGNSNYSSSGTGKDLKTLQSLAFYTTAGNWYDGAWSITSSSVSNPSAVWKICDGVYYPYLQQQGNNVCTPAIVATAAIHGSITPDGYVNVASGGNAVFNISPDTYYTVDKILVDGVAVSDNIVNNTYTIKNVTTSHTLFVTFKLNFFCGGDGTQNNPYQICSAASLKTLADFVNAGNGNETDGKFFKLMNDIDLSGYANWDPIGNNNTDNASTCFQGAFDGNNKIVQNLTVNLPTRNAIGLFGIITKYATIRNLGVENCNIKGGVYENVGGLVGRNNGGGITNCYVKGVVSGGNFVGGLAGYSTSNSLITQSYAKCNVNGNDRVGGLLGQNDNAAKVSDSYATGNVNGSQWVGGLVGYNLGNSIISAQGVDVRSIISYCYATGIVTGSRVVGGLVGGNYDSGVTANPLIINNVAANSSVTANLSANVNCIAGGNSGTIQNNYALNSMAVQSAGGVAGISKTMAELQSRTFYTTAGNWNSGAWNMASVWDICENKTLPWLRWQAINCDNVGIFETKRTDKIVIFPNPTHNSFVINFDEIASIKLYDMLGKEVLTQAVNGKTEINISHLPKGIYNVQIISGGQVIGNSKIVKQ